MTMLGFETLAERDQETWMRKSVEFLDRNGVSYFRDTQDAVIYLTAVYLYNLREHTIEHMHYPCFVVHCFEENWRFVCDSHPVAFARFKRAAKRGNRAGPNRVALFHWRSVGDCVVKFATEGYPYDKDYIPA